MMFYLWSPFTLTSFLLSPPVTVTLWHSPAANVTISITCVISSRGMDKVVPRAHIWIQCMQVCLYYLQSKKHLLFSKREWKHTKKWIKHTDTEKRHKSREYMFLTCTKTAFVMKTTRISCIPFILLFPVLLRKKKNHDKMWKWILS